jgi:hypothetical protein
LVFELENKLADFDLSAKAALLNLHWSIEQFDEANFYRLNEILAAKEPEERPVDPLTLLGRGRS